GWLAEPPEISHPSKVHSPVDGDGGAVDERRRGVGEIYSEARDLVRSGEPPLTVRITFSPCQRHNEMIVRCRLIGQWYIRRSRPLTTRSTEHVSPCAMTSESSETRPRT